MNRLPHFVSKVPVDGYGDIDIGIHFLFQKTLSPHSIPLLFVHGWSGSFLEGSRTLPLLQDELDMEEYGERGLLLVREVMEEC
jgi:pimeloyl-ACP methyl ester carboxylesterase